jgi:hypothetical protein
MWMGDKPMWKHGGNRQEPAKPQPILSKATVVDPLPFALTEAELHRWLARRESDPRAA